MTSFEPEMSPDPSPPDNPYESPAAELEKAAEARLSKAQPQIWPAFVVPLMAIVAALIVSGVALAFAAVVTNNFDSLRDPSRQADWLADFGSSPFGLAILVLPGQVVFAAFAMIAAIFSRENWLQRLGFRIGNLPIWTWLLFLLGTPIVGMLAAQLMSRIASEPSAQMKMLERMFQFDSLGSLIALLALVSLLPGIVEEILFRGYMQRRLLTRLPAGTAILLSSMLFAAAHMDPMHAMGVLPLGIWLGIIAWRADSIMPAIFGHIGNNGYAIVMSKIMGPDITTDKVSSPVSTLIMASMLAFFGSIVVLVAMGSRRRPTPVVAEKSLPETAEQDPSEAVDERF